MSQRTPTDAEATKYAGHYNIHKVEVDAFKYVFPDSKATPKSLREKASLFHGAVNVQSMIEELQESIQGKAKEAALFTVEKALEELEMVRVLAVLPEDDGKPQLNAAVQATMGKAKIAGMLVDRQEVKDVASFAVSGSPLSPDEWLKETSK